MDQFDFGKNWLSFSTKALTEVRIKAARKEFEGLFEGILLNGRKFLDIGFGQGLSLLIACESGAEVTGCDINPKCKEALAVSAKHFGIEPSFPVVIGSILEQETVDKLGKYDIVHSWGVLHHTGDMNKAIKNACSLIDKNGYLVLAVYNRHWSSPIWKIIKFVYCKAPTFFRKLMIISFIPVIFTAKFIVTGRSPFRQQRGMEFLHNVIDWIGGHPYEYASVEEIQCILEKEGFECLRVTRAEVPTGCNEFVFRKKDVKSQFMPLPLC